MTRYTYPTCPVCNMAVEHDPLGYYGECYKEWEETGNKRQADEDVEKTRRKEHLAIKLKKLRLDRAELEDIMNELQGIKNQLDAM